jgi:hypothetical protein
MAPFASQKEREAVSWLLKGPFTLNALEFLSQRSRGRISQMTAQGERTHGRTAIPWPFARRHRRFKVSVFLPTDHGLDEGGPLPPLLMATHLLTCNDLGGRFLHHPLALAVQLMKNAGFS